MARECDGWNALPRAQRSLADGIVVAGGVLELRGEDVEDVANTTLKGPLKRLEGTVIQRN